MRDTAADPRHLLRLAPIYYPAKMLGKKATFALCHATMEHTNEYDYHKYGIRTHPPEHAPQSSSSITPTLARHMASRSLTTCLHVLASQLSSSPTS